MTEEAIQCEIPAFDTPGEEIIEILKDHKKIAVVGISLKSERDSNRVANYLMNNGYEIIPVNPTIEEFNGIKAYPSIKDIPDDVKIEVVDIFRKMEAVPGIVDEAISKGANVIWMQEGIVHNESAKKALDAGLKVVMNKCMLKEHTKMTRMEEE